MLRKFWREIESSRIRCLRFGSVPNPQTESLGSIFSDKEPSAILWREGGFLVHPRKTFHKKRFVQEFPAAEEGPLGQEHISRHLPAGVLGLLFKHQANRFAIQPFSPPPPTFYNDL